MSLVAPIVLPDATAEAGIGFSPLRALLRTISTSDADLQVRVQLPPIYNHISLIALLREPPQSEKKSKCSSHV